MKQIRSGWLRLLITSLLLLTGCASGTSFVRPGADFKATGKVGVVAESSVLQPEAKAEIADLFSMALLKKGYDVVDRANIEQLSREADFQNESSMTSSSGRSKLAINNISSIIVVNVREFSDKISMTAKMVDVGTGKMLWMGEGSGSLKSGLGTMGGALIGSLVGHVVSRTGLGTVAGGVAGGIVGKALEPEQANLARSVIEKVCSDLPAVN